MMRFELGDSILLSYEFEDSFYIFECRESVDTRKKRELPSGTPLRHLFIGEDHTLLDQHMCIVPFTFFDTEYFAILRQVEVYFCRIKYDLSLLFSPLFEDTIERV